MKRLSGTLQTTHPKNVLIFLEKILILYVSFLCAHQSLSVSSRVQTRKRKSLSSLESTQGMGGWLLEMGKHTMSDLKRKN